MYTFLECYQLEYPLFLHKTVSKRTVHSVHVATQRLGPTTSTATADDSIGSTTILKKKGMPEYGGIAFDIESA